MGKDQILETNAVVGRYFNGVHYMQRSFKKDLERKPKKGEFYHGLETEEMHRPLKEDVQRGGQLPVKPTLQKRNACRAKTVKVARRTACLLTCGLELIRSVCGPVPQFILGKH